MTESGDRGKALMLSWLRQLESVSKTNAHIAQQQVVLAQQQAQLSQQIADLHSTLLSLEGRLDGLTELFLDDGELLEHRTRSGARSLGASLAQGIVRGALGPFRVPPPPPPRRGRYPQ